MTLKVIEDATVGQRVTTKEGLEAVSVEGGHFREITIGEGEMFLLPGELPIDQPWAIGHLTEI